MPLFAWEEGHRFERPRSNFQHTSNHRFLHLKRRGDQTAVRLSNAGEVIRVHQNNDRQCTPAGPAIGLTVQNLHYFKSEPEAEGHHLNWSGCVREFLVLGEPAFAQRNPHCFAAS